MLTLSEQHLANLLGQTLAYMDANDAQTLAMARSWARETGTTTPDRFVFLVRRAKHLIKTDNVQGD